MGYVAHPHCSPPRSDDPDKIWRYMDFTQFVSLLENDELFFPKADGLDDPFEGSLPKSHEQNASDLDQDPDLFDSSVNWATQLLPKMRKICKKYTYLSCWHLNDGESAAMWDLYLKSNQGICIQSTISDVKESIDTKDDVYISKVNYIDYEDNKMPEWEGIGNTLLPFIYKRDSFEHEEEVRVIIQDLPWHDQGDTSKITSKNIQKEQLDENSYPSGKTVSVDLDELIGSIRVSPEAEPWIETLTQDVCDTYGLDPDLVVDSRMTREPNP